MRKLLLIPLLFTAACGDGGTGPGDAASLTAAEAAELNRAVFGIVQEMVRAAPLGALSSGSTLDEGVLAAGNSFTVPIQETHACTPSGSTAITGTATVQWGDPVGSSALQAQISATPAACAHRTQKGDVITISGDPDIDVTVSAAADASGPTAFQLAETGAFTWARGAATGRCTVDVGAQLNPAKTHVVVSGTFCGFPVSESIPIQD
ncbi:MAG TPA: hypothetical protein VHG08_08220 [Longimicrobium sp.]|nr:hypothetical protein [Longimicrobium sp.]